METERKTVQVAALEMVLPVTVDFTPAPTMWDDMTDAEIKAFVAKED